MNNVTLSGQLLHDPVTRIVDNNAVCELRLAAERRRHDQRGDVIVDTCTGQLGLDAPSQLTTGDLIGVHGWLSTNELAGDRGSRVPRTDVVADRLDRLGPTETGDAADAHLEAAYEDRYEIDEAL